MSRDAPDAGAARDAERQRHARLALDLARESGDAQLCRLLELIAPRSGESS